MSLLTAAKQNSPNFGFAPDFVSVAIGPLIKDIKRKGIRVVSNAGGVNVYACADALKQVAKKADVDLKIAVVTGDDLMTSKEELSTSGVTDMISGIKLPKTVQSMNAYLGAGAITKALNQGADIVVTGRCVDSAVVLGPLQHTFGWKYNDYDLLSAGSLAGHLVECGAQVTGGIYTDWHTVPAWDNIGFPIVECSDDGTFIVTKPPQTGGLVSFGTVAEQLVYEIGNPKQYMLPDVTCDFSQVQIQPVPGKEKEAMYVKGAKGSPPSNHYKVSATYADGYRLTVVSTVAGPWAAEKARRTGEAILKRTRRMFKQLGITDYTKTLIQVIGSEQTYGPHAYIDNNPREVALWLAAHHSNKKALEILAREVAPAGTGMAPGLMSLVGGRPKVSPVLKLFSFLHPKDKIQVKVHMDDKEEIVTNPTPVKEEQETEYDSPISDSSVLKSGSHTFRLVDLAYTRSGDKGNSSNIGVIARHPYFMPYLRQALTEDVVHKYFQHVLEPMENNRKTKQVTRYELPGIHALNFILENSLGGGGIASLRCDPQGKAYGQMLLDMKIENVPNLVEMAEIISDQ
ncbi:uncharacterized protein LOC102801419 [Saccoglossus kowalevskii]